MKKKFRVLLAMILLALPHSASAYTYIQREREEWQVCQLRNTVYEDYKNFYSSENLRKLAIGLGVAGVFANTLVDREIQDWYQESLKSESTDNFSEGVKLFGEGVLSVPVCLGAFILGELTDHTRLGSTIGEWGGRSLRTFLVGAPPMLFLQTALGASRPNEADPYWRPFRDNNGVSGHSFMGAVPFITAAKMTDNLYLKYPLYLGSILCGLSRINDDAHYFSQSALGWWLAYLAATSVEKTETKNQKVVIAPTLIPNGVGVTVVIRF